MSGSSRLVSQNGMDKFILVVGLIGFQNFVCCFQIIVNIKECFSLWLLLGDRNNLKSSYDEEVFRGNSEFYFLDAYMSPETYASSLIQLSPALPTG